jgi:hypothetical protein
MAPFPTNFSNHSIAVSKNCYIDSNKRVESVAKIFGA